jgi:hypothetical protein
MFIDKQSRNCGVVWHLGLYYFMTSLHTHAQKSASTVVPYFDSLCLGSLWQVSIETERRRILALLRAYMKCYNRMMAWS